MKGFGLERILRRGTVAVFAALLPALCAAEETLWEPSDFKGDWVKVVDRAENGCWTNIGESTAYASDQLELAGFTVVEKPEVNERALSPILADDLAVLVIEVRGQRWNSGMCIGHVMTEIVGAVSLRYEQDRVFVNPVGFPLSNTLWDEKNFNTLVLDHIKNFVSDWVEFGKIDSNG